MPDTIAPQPVHGTALGVAPPRPNASSMIACNWCSVSAGRDGKSFLKPLARGDDWDKPIDRFAFPALD